MDILEEPTDPIGESESEGELDAERIEKKILFLLEIYPIISPTMLQVGIGPVVKPRVWRPILKKLIDEGKVVFEEPTVATPLDQYRMVKRIRLATTKIEPKPAAA